MNEVWEVVFDLYREFRRGGRTHQEARNKAIWNAAVDAKDRKGQLKEAPVKEVIDALEAWNEDGGGDWGVLRARLRDAWTTGELDGR